MLINLPVQIETVRIPELARFDSFGPITVADQTAWWLAAFDKTVKVDAQSLYQFFQTGGAGYFPPVVLGDKLIHVVTAIEAGGTVVGIPAIAGQNFFLERDGQPLLTTEFNILNAGGFEITIPGDVLVEGQRFVLTLYALQGGSSSGGGSSSTSPFIKGVVPISSNRTFDVVNDTGKLLQLRGAGTKITVTLPLVEDLPVNTIIPIEATINNTVEQKIATQSGQLIYLNNLSKTEVYMRAGEVLWLYRGEDGYYIVNDFARIYLQLALPHAAYKVGLNQLLCKGQLVNRSDYPRLWEYVQTLGGSVVSDTTWQTASATTTNGQETLRPYRGCFSIGDGSLTFRLPDLMGLFLQGLTSETGNDPNRVVNKAGGFRRDEVGPHQHDTMSGDIPGDGNPAHDFGSGPSKPLVGHYANSGTGTTDLTSKNTSPSGETIVANAGVLWVINV